MKASPWDDSADDLVAPAPGVPYTGVLRLEPVTTGALQSIGGVLAAMVGYAMVLPGLAWLLLAVSWLVRGRPVPFSEFRAAGLRFETIDGMFATHMAIASLIIVTMLVVRYVHHRHPRWLSSVQPGFRWRFALACVIVATVVMNTVFWISRGGEEFTWQPDAHILWWLLVIVLTAPLQAAGEEFLFRGYLLQAAGTIGRSPWLAVAISAVIFATMHGTQNMPLFVDRLGFGLLAGALVLLTGGLEAAVAAHAVNNVFAFGYAALSGGVAHARTMQESTWTTTGWNLLAYALVLAACAWLGRRMNVSRRTPGLATEAGMR